MKTFYKSLTIIALSLLTLVSCSKDDSEIESDGTIVTEKLLTVDDLKDEEITTNYLQVNLYYCSGKLSNSFIFDVTRPIESDDEWQFLVGKIGNSCSGVVTGKKPPIESTIMAIPFADAEYSYFSERLDKHIFEYATIEYIYNYDWNPEL